MAHRCSRRSSCRSLSKPLNTLYQVHDGLLDSLACLGRYLEALNAELLFVVLQHFLKGYFLVLLVDLVAQYDDHHVLYVQVLV